MKKLGRLLLHNKQAGPLAQMTVSPTQSHENQILTSIVVHTAAIVLSNQNRNILLPFVNMMCNPATLAVSSFYKINNCIRDVETKYYSFSTFLILHNFAFRIHIYLL